MATETPTRIGDFYLHQHHPALKPIKEALFHSRLDHPGNPDRQRAALERIAEAERAVDAVDAILQAQK